MEGARYVYPRVGEWVTQHEDGIFILNQSTDVNQIIYLSHAVFHIFQYFLCLVAKSPSMIVCLFL